MTSNLYYDEKRCAYAYSGKIGCTRCLTVCPNQAITIDNQKITVNLQRCDEVGNCITVCPSDALTNTSLTLSQHFVHIQQQLQLFYQQYHTSPILLFHAIDLAELGDISAYPIVSINITDLNSFGVESWLTCLVNGAKKVIFLYTLESPIEIITTLSTQLQYAHILLRAMGYDETVLQLISYQDVNAIKAELFAHFDDKTDKIQLESLNTSELLANKQVALHFAMNHLYQNAPNKPISTNLPANAPFGQVLLDTTACTLCFSCVTVCPTKAFSSGQQQPQLYFSEYLCIQCQLCVAACPEDALQLQSRFAFVAQLERITTLLHEELPFHCVSCGKPFATQTMIKHIVEKLRNHSMFQGEALQRLQMCEVCRIKAMVQAQNHSS